MKMTFDLNGKDRKQLVKAISEITGARAEYKFMPTCAYEIDFFTVTKEGTLEFPDRSDTEIVEQVLAGLAERGFEVVSSVYENGESGSTDDCEETPTAADTAEESDTEEVSEETETTADTATQPDTAPTTESGNTDRFSISMSREFFDTDTLQKLDRTINSKGELFKMAFKTDDLSYSITEDRVTFDWFPLTGECGEGLAYSNFIDLLAKSLKESKRVNASKTQTENPKFAMRVFLIRIGMVGAGFKETRRILLRFLEGSSAFRKGAPNNEDTE